MYFNRVIYGDMYASISSYILVNFGAYSNYNRYDNHLRMYLCKYIVNRVNQDYTDTYNLFELNVDYIDYSWGIVNI